MSTYMDHSKSNARKCAIKRSHQCLLRWMLCWCPDTQHCCSHFLRQTPTESEAESRQWRDIEQIISRLSQSLQFFLPMDLQLLWTICLLLRLLTGFLVRAPFSVSIGGIQLKQVTLWSECFRSVQFSHSVMSDSLPPHGLQHARLSYPLPTTQSSFWLMSVESVMPSKHLIFCRPLLLQPSIFPSIRVF